jgi:hypothetical protein
MLSSKIEQVYTTLLTTLRSGGGGGSGLRWLRSRSCGGSLALLLFLTNIVGNALYLL